MPEADTMAFERIKKIRKLIDSISGISDKVNLDGLQGLFEKLKDWISAGNATKLFDTIKSVLDLFGVDSSFFDSILDIFKPKNPEELGVFTAFSASGVGQITQEEFEKACQEFSAEPRAQALNLTAIFAIAKLILDLFGAFKR